MMTKHALKTYRTHCWRTSARFFLAQLFSDFPVSHHTSFIISQRTQQTASTDIPTLSQTSHDRHFFLF